MRAYPCQGPAWALHGLGGEERQAAFAALDRVHVLQAQSLSNHKLCALQVFQQLFASMLTLLGSTLLHDSPCTRPGMPLWGPP